MSTYFHCSSSILGIGSEIKPGNWGRMIKTYSAPNTEQMLTPYREAILELSRQIYKPSAPSRLNCIFALPSLIAARSFRDQHQTTNLIYEVKPTTFENEVHVGNYAIVGPPQSGSYFLHIESLAMEYWTAEDVSEADAEILLSCSIQIVGGPHD